MADASLVRAPPVTQAAAPASASMAYHPSSRAGFIPRLESFRGYGCIMVAMVHVSQSPMTGGMPLRAAPDLFTPLGSVAAKLYAVVFNGHAALIMFLVLSGFVLSLSLERGPRDILSAAGRFFCARLLRIYPAIVANLAIFLAVFLAFGVGIPGVADARYEFVSLVRNALLVDTTINGVMWTLQLEVLGVPLIFLGYLVQRRFGYWPLVGLLGVLMAASFAKEWSRLLGSAQLGLIYTFLFGLLVPNLGRSLVGRLSHRQALLVMGGATAVFLSARETLGYTSNWAPVVESITAWLLISAIAYRGELAIFRPLDWKLAHFFGRISYSFYLAHPLSLIVLWRMSETLAQWYDLGIPSIVICLVLGAVSTLAVTPLAWLSFRSVEVPGMRLGAATSRSFDRSGRHRGARQPEVENRSI